MKKNVLINGFNNPLGKQLANDFKQNGFYVYGTDEKEDYESICDRSLRFDLNQFVQDVEYRIRFTQIFEELMPRVDVLINTIDTTSKSTLATIDLGEWQDTLNNCVTGPMLLCKLLLQKLIDSKGTIINLCGLGSGSNSTTLLSAAKGFSAALSNEFSEQLHIFSVSGNEFSPAIQNSTGESNSIVNVSRLIVLLATNGGGLSNGSDLRVDIQPK